MITYPVFDERTHTFIWTDDGAIFTESAPYLIGDDGKAYPMPSEQIAEFLPDLAAILGMEST